MRGRALGEISGSGKTMGGLGLREGEMKAVSFTGLGSGLKERGTDGILT